MFGLGTFRAGRRRSGGVVPPQALRPLLLIPASVTAGAPTSGTVAGTTDGSTLAASVLPAGFTLDGAQRTWRYDGSAGARAASFTLRETLAGAANSPRETVASVAVTAASGLAGFALNGSTNPALRAMLARVAAGTGRGRVVFKGDSTTMGQGGGITSGQSSDPMVQGASAALHRPSAIFAAQLTGIGYPTLDLGFVGGNGTGSSTGNTEWLNYEPRASYENGQWNFNYTQDLAGGGFFQGTSGNILDFTPTVSCDRYELVFFNVGGTVTIAIGGAFPSFIDAPGATVSGSNVTMPGTANGFTRVTVRAPSLSTAPLRIASGPDNPFLRSVRGWNSAAAAIDILNHAAGGAKSGDQASVNASGNAWNNNEALAFDAPDLTIVNLGLNDPASEPLTTYTANLQAIITTAKASGDVLLVSPHPASPSFKDIAAQTAQRDAVASLAASNGVAYIDLYRYFGSWAAISSRSVDGLVHLNRGGYAEIGQVYRQCLQAMAV